MHLVGLFQLITVNFKLIMETFYYHIGITIILGILVYLARLIARKETPLRVEFKVMQHRRTFDALMAKYATLDKLRVGELFIDGYSHPYIKFYTIRIYLVSPDYGNLKLKTGVVIRLDSLEENSMGRLVLNYKLLTK